MLTASVTFALVTSAFGGLPQQLATDRFSPTWHDDVLGLPDVSIDSGWIPADSPVQVRLFVHAADSIDIEMPGEASYEWNAGNIAVAGDLEAGEFSIDVGAQIEACVRFDVAGIQWESEIFGPYDYAIAATGAFTPYLLPGNPERPVVIEDATDGVTVASVPVVPDIVVASGALDIDVAAEVTGSLSSLRVEMTTALGSTAQIDEEWVAEALAADPGPEPLAAQGALISTLQSAPTIIVRPHLTMSILGQDYEIVGIDIPVALPPIDDEIVFDPEPLVFDRPPEPPGADSSGGDGGEGEDDGGGSSGIDGTSSTSTGDDSGSGGSGAATDGDHGCGCRSSAGAASWAWLLLVLGFRRRLAT